MDYSNFVRVMDNFWLQYVVRKIDVIMQGSKLGKTFSCISRPEIMFE